MAECVVSRKGLPSSLSNLQEAVGLMLDGEELTDWNLAPNPLIVVMIERELN